MAWSLVLMAAVTCAQAGTVEIHDLESAAVADNAMGITPTRRLLVYLPDGYSAARRSYPTLYRIPGWETPASREYVASLDAAISKGWMEPAIVVSVDVREGIVLLNSPVFGQWEDFMVDEVVPFIDERYRTIPRDDGRAIMGHSTGGYGAMILAARHPGVWGAVGLNDASMWAGCSLPVNELPADFDDYSSSSGYIRAWMQVAIAAAYEPSSPLLFRGALIGDGGQVIEPPWDAYCLRHEAGVQLYADALLRLATVQVLVAGGTGGVSNKRPNSDMWRDMQALGVGGALIEMPGTHGGDRGTRFVLLARGILPKLYSGYPDARAQTTAWSDIRAARATP